MTKSELVDAVAASTQGSEGDPLTKKDVATVVDAVFGSIQSELVAADGGVVNIAGFGKFESVHKPARMATTFGVEKQIPAKNVVKFKPAKALKDAVA
jgi:DNA-binding protein HU-beta